MDAMDVEETNAALAAESIDCSGAWLFWAEPPDAAFVGLIEKVGQLEPVLVAREQGCCRLVTGYKRVLACQKLQRPVRCRIMNADDRMKGRVYLHLNRQRRITGADLIRALRFFQTVPGCKDRIGLESEFEGLVPGKMLGVLKHWLHLEPFWDAGLHAGRVPFEAGPILSGLEPLDRQACEPFFRELAWSWNKARQFLTQLLESAKRDGLQPEALLRRERLTEILGKELSPNDCLKELLQRSHSIRYPVLTRLEQGFQTVQADCIRKTRWRILPEQHFEINGFLLQTRVSSPQDLERSLDQLQRLSEQDAFEPIWHWQQESLD
ncbi:MAG: ParB N-terminal domain-containing protein [Desulfohalobiaceae bacterium]|nr:ParB N-terminal domain-containing protein [Desulfohalobiaceae bacterium]